MGSMAVRSLDTPDETRKFENGVAEVIRAGSTSLVRTTFQPGWKWSKDVKPLAGTDLCKIHHQGYCISGRLHVRAADGTEVEISAGDAYDIEPGHDGWVVGDEPYVAVDFSQQMTEFAKPAD